MYVVRRKNRLNPIHVVYILLYMKTKDLIILSILLFSSTFFLIPNLNAQSSIDKKVKKISLLDRLQQEEDIIPLEIITNIETVYADWKIQNYHWGKTTIQFYTLRMEKS